MKNVCVIVAAFVFDDEYQARAYKPDLRFPNAVTGNIQSLSCKADDMESKISGLGSVVTYFVNRDDH